MLKQVALQWIWLFQETLIDLPTGTSAEKVVSTSEAFGTLLNDSGVISWGKDDLGGKPPKSVASFLGSGIVDSSGNYAVISALTNDGQMLSWGDGDFGGRTKDGPVAFDARAEDLF